MARPFTHWTVLPHDKLVQVDERLMTVTGKMHMPLVDFPRRMTVVRLDSGALVVFSAIALDEDEMERLEAWGTPAFLVVPCARHRMDVRIWKDRYPDLKVIAPPDAVKAVEALVPVDGTGWDFGDPHVKLLVVPGTGEGELALEVKTAHGTTLVINELIWNVGDLPGLGGAMARLLGMTGPAPKIPTVTQLASVRDRAALGAQLRAWSHLDGLDRILVSHGAEIVQDAAGTLERLAKSL